MHIWIRKRGEKGVKMLAFIMILTFRTGNPVQHIHLRAERAILGTDFIICVDRKGEIIVLAGKLRTKVLRDRCPALIILLTRTYVMLFACFAGMVPYCWNRPIRHA